MSGKNKQERGLRYNEGKTMFSLISTFAMEGLARVLMFGLRKYIPWNWAKGLEVHEVLNSLERHIKEIKQGHTIDAESGLPIVDHMQCNTMFLSHYYHTGEWDDLSEGLECNQLRNLHTKKQSGTGKSRSSRAKKLPKQSKTTGGKGND